jgi:hypothetical protein
MRRFRLIVAAASLSGLLSLGLHPPVQAQTLSPTPPISADGCGLGGKRTVIPPDTGDSTCKHHLAGPERLAKVSG